MNRKYDRAKQIIVVGSFAICVAWMLSFVITRVTLFPTPPYGIKDPPAGYSIETNGKYFRVVWPNGVEDIHHKETYEDAVENAWYWWEVKRRKPAQWRPVK